MLRKSAARLLLFTLVAGVYAPSSGGDGSVVRGKRWPLELKQLYWKKVEGLGSASTASAALSADGKQVFVLSGEVIEAIDWRSDKRVGSVSFEERECAEGERRYVRLVSESHGELIVKHCGILYLLKSAPFHVERILATDATRDIETLEVSPDGQWVAVGSLVPGVRGTRQLDVYRLDPWKQVASFGEYHGWIRFTADSKYLAIEKVQVEGKIVKATGLEVRTVPEGSMVQSWWPGPGLETFGQMWTLSVPSQMVLEGPQGPVVCDVLRGQILRTVKSELDTKDMLVDPQGRWAIGDVADDPQDAPYWQNLRAWDLQTGELVFETPRIPWGKTKGESNKLSLLGVSNDGTLVLLGGDGGITLNEVKYKQ